MTKLKDPAKPLPATAKTPAKQPSREIGIEQLKRERFGQIVRDLQHQTEALSANADRLLRRLA